MPVEIITALKHHVFELGLWEPLTGFPDAYTLDTQKILEVEKDLDFDPDPHNAPDYSELKTRLANMLPHDSMLLGQSLLRRRHRPRAAGHG